VVHAEGHRVVLCQKYLSVRVQILILVLSEYSLVDGTTVCDCDDGSVFLLDLKTARGESECQLPRNNRAAVRRGKNLLLLFRPVQIQRTPSIQQLIVEIRIQVPTPG